MAVNNPKITMMQYKPPYLDGRVLINGTERVVQPFEVDNGISASDKEKALIKRAEDLIDAELVDERKADGRKTIAVNLEGL